MTAGRVCDQCGAVELDLLTVEMYWTRVGAQDVCSPSCALDAVDDWTRELLSVRHQFVAGNEDLECSECGGGSEEPQHSRDFGRLSMVEEA